MRLLVFNAGSSSRKFELTDRIAAAPARRISVGSFADTDGSGLFRWSAGSSNGGHPPPAHTLADAAGLALAVIEAARRRLGVERPSSGNGSFRASILAPRAVGSGRPEPVAPERRANANYRP